MEKERRTFARIDSFSRKTGSTIKEIFIDPIIHPNTFPEITYNLEGKDQNLQGLNRRQFLLQESVPVSLRLKASIREIGELFLHPISSTTITVNIPERTISATTKKRNT